MLKSLDQILLTHWWAFVKVRIWVHLEFLYDLEFSSSCRGTDYRNYLTNLKMRTCVSV